MERKKILKVHPDDNVIVALQDIGQGTSVSLEGKTYQPITTIPAKHKFFEQDMNPGDKVIMYGVLVGKVQYAIKAGELMTTDNVKHAAEPFAYRPYHYQWQAPDTAAFKHRTFNGYHRKDGRVGTANYWLFLPTVFCENRNLDIIKEALHNELGYAVTDKYKEKARILVELYRKGQDISDADLDIKESVVPAGRVFPNVDGIKFLNHQGGCGGTRQDAAILSKLLTAYADHPNVSGITVLSLGCQNLQVADFKEDLKQRNPDFDKPVYIFEQQQSQK